MALLLMMSIGWLRAESAADLTTAQQYLDSGQFEQAYELLDTLVERSPNDAQVHYWRGAAAGMLAANASMFKAGRYAKVVRSSFEKAIDLDPDYLDAYQGLISFHLQAPGIVGGSKKKAMALAKQLSDIAPVEGALATAQIQMARKDVDDARETLAALVEQVPEDPRPWVQRGLFAQSDEDYATAHMAFVNASKVGDTSPSHQRARLQGLYQIGRTAVFADARRDEGITALRDYLSQDLLSGLPGKDWANFRLGILLEASGQTDEAVAAFAAAREITDDDQLIKLLAERS